MDKVMEEYEEIFSSLTEVPLHCQDKHSIDLTPNALLPNVVTPHVNTQTESTHVLSKEKKLLNASITSASMFASRSTTFWTNLIPSSTEFSSHGGT